MSEKHGEWADHTLALQPSDGPGNKGEHSGIHTVVLSSPNHPQATLSDQDSHHHHDQSIEQALFNPSINLLWIEKSNHRLGLKDCQNQPTKNTGNPL